MANAKTECRHAAYRIVDGELVCADCGAPSPKAKLIDGRIVRIGEKAIHCPKCGYEIQEAADTKTERAHEDKAQRGREDKARR